MTKLELKNAGAHHSEKATDKEKDKEELSVREKEVLACAVKGNDKQGNSRKPVHIAQYGAYAPQKYFAKAQHPFHIGTHDLRDSQQTCEP